MHYISTFLAILLFARVDADGFLGCGGFVKSDVDINYSLVEIKLYTSHGSIKYETDCAPNNGYYLIPVYDKGDFVLKVEPPPGWSFEPSNVELHIDGTSDRCSKGEDINFVFTGFSLYGQVISSGQSIGPSDVSVTLHVTGQNDPVSTVRSAADGKYSFSKLLPGQYEVKSSHTSWVFDKDVTKVVIGRDNANVESGLVVKGYPVNGVVYSEKEPIKGVKFVLFSKIIACTCMQGVVYSEKEPIKGVKFVLFSKSSKQGRRRSRSVGVTANIRVQSRNQGVAAIIHSRSIGTQTDVEPVQVIQPPEAVRQESQESIQNVSESQGETGSQGESGSHGDIQSQGGSQSQAGSEYCPSSYSESSQHIYDTGSSPRGTKKYIVTEECLLQLLGRCPKCHRPVTPHIYDRKGTYIRVKRECNDCGCVDVWENQSLVKNTPSMNVLIAASILFSGMSPEQTIRMFEHVGISIFCPRTFFSFQSHALSMTLQLYWNVQRGDIINAIKGKNEPLVCLGDGRCDSPGHSAKFGSYTIIDAKTNKIVDFQLVQSNEVKNSHAMELEGLERSLKELAEEGVAVGTLITDRHTQIRAVLRDEYGYITHLFDLWHFIKALLAKVRKLSKMKDGKDVDPWQPSIKAHMYWCVTSTPANNTALRVAKWTSLTNHMMDIHEGHSELYPKCKHGDLPQRKYIKQGSFASKKLEQIVNKKAVLADVKQLSAVYHTYPLESFHSVVNHFAPKSVAYSYQGMTNRLILAALHHNENGAKSQSSTRAGELQFTVQYVKGNEKGTAAPVKMPSTYDYVEELLQLSMSLMEDGASVLSEDIGPVPQPLSATNYLKSPITGCDSSKIPGFSSNEKLSPTCHVTSSTKGVFHFPVLPTGDYVIVPFYKGEHIMFDVIPERMEFSIGHSSLTLPEDFEVAGFSVSGKVLDSANGRGIVGAKILLNRKEQGLTNKVGLYHLENMKTGLYSIDVLTKDIRFETSSIKITPNTPQLPDIVAARKDIRFETSSIKITPNTPQLPDIVAASFRVCGRVTIDKLPESLGQPMKREVTLTDAGSKIIVIDTDTEGKFCTYLQPGDYVAKAPVSEKESRAGLRLIPSEQTVTVTTAPVNGIKFTQFRASISGKVICFEKCGFIEISIERANTRDSKLISKVTESEKVASFSFKDLLPGKYKVVLLNDAWCWKEKIQDVEITETAVTGADFTQTGYIFKCSLSHEITLHFAHEKKEGSVGSFQLNKGTNRFCLAQSGVYRLTPDSCHRFDKDVYTYDTSKPSTLSLTAVKHLMTGVLKSDTNQSDISVQITSSTESEAVTIGPLVATSLSTVPKDTKTTEGGSKSKPQKDPGPFVYNFTYWAKTADSLEITPASNKLLFYPKKISVYIPGDKCLGEVASFETKLGLFIEGRIVPSLAGVKVIISSSDPEVADIAVETGGEEKYSYSVGPLEPEAEYTVTADKPGYILDKLEGSIGSFKAFKLAEIIVKVSEESGAPLTSVLLSLSGGSDYRSNNLTPETGVMTFISLNPGQYYLRALMKEYRFEPASQMIQVGEGSTTDISIKGVRVAFSGHGVVTSLIGEPESDIVVEAIGQGKCDGHQESDSDIFYGHGVVTSLNGEPESGIVVEAIGQGKCDGHQESDSDIYYGHGVVTSLNGEPESGIVVEAIGQGKCDGHQEESKTETDGVFIIRGLQPICDYIVQVQSSSVNQHIERSTPKQLSIQPSQHVYGLHFIAFRRVNQLDISGNVITSPEYLSTLKVKLFRGDNPDVAVHTASLSTTTFFYFPSLPIDNQLCTVVLETSLSKSMYDIELPDIKFVANVSHRHFTIHFTPQKKAVDQEYSQSSVLFLPLTILIMIGIYNHELVKTISILQQGDDETLISNHLQLGEPRLWLCCLAQGHTDSLSTVLFRESKPYVAQLISYLGNHLQQFQQRQRSPSPVGSDVDISNLDVGMKKRVKTRKT